MSRARLLLISWSPHAEVHIPYSLNKACQEKFISDHKLNAQDQNLGFRLHGPFKSIT